MPRTPLAEPLSNVNVNCRMWAISLGELDGKVSSHVIVMVARPTLLLPPLRDAVLADDAGAVGVGVGRADRVLDDHVVGHQRQPAGLVLGLDAAP